MQPLSTTRVDSSIPEIPASASSQKLAAAKRRKEKAMEGSSETVSRTDTSLQVAVVLAMPSPTQYWNEDTKAQSSSEGYDSREPPDYSIGLITIPWTFDEDLIEGGKCE
ncbi:hypothetical protein EVG20_g3096 [Dentipellis fragilis]|uniref:Uncharacterized protein n=1 Tax=Dentipellis fragilis TaxID=205917 RepID=A0A4Y9Z441_9AGAM|nr:hypothetical protein EVG20_g3096 [Dentipellis fragilis]